MKNLFTLTLILIGLTAFSQKAVRVSSFGGTDTISVMESDIYKVDNATDSTATVWYKFRGIESVVVADTNEAFYIANTNRLFSPSNLGYTINADRIDGISKVTDTTCLMFYLQGNRRITFELDTNISAVQAIINGL